MLDAAASERLLCALDLAAFAEKLMRHRFQQECPQATEEQIEERLLLWMQGLDYEGPGAQAP